MDYDKVLVLDAGHIAQFDSPHKLAQDNSGIFAQMLETTGNSMENHLKQIALQSYARKLPVIKDIIGEKDQAKIL